MRYLLNAVYLGLLLFASPWLLYRRLRRGRYRRGGAAKLWGSAPLRSGDAPCIWLHAVSVGEVHLLEPIVRRLQAQRPDVEIVISTTTDTGFAAAERKFSEHTVFYCPLDFSWAVSRALRRVRPDLLVLSELELWPNLLAEAARRGIPTAVVNGRLSERSARGYSWIAPLARQMLEQIDLLAVQTEEYAARFRKLGAEPSRLVVTGSVKFDGAVCDRDNPETRELAALTEWDDAVCVLLAGSTQAPEEAMALSAYRRLADRFPQLRLVLTPRHPERFAEVADLLEREGVAFQRRSELGRHNRLRERVLLVDAMGELRGWWGLSQIAYVGGSQGSRGGQNMIEPAAYGAAVCFGPRTRNFRDVVSLLLERDAAKVVRSAEELQAFTEVCLSDPTTVARRGAAAQRLVREQQGASQRTVDRLLPFLPSVKVSSPALRAGEGKPNRRFRRLAG